MKLRRSSALFSAASAALLSLSILHAQEPPPPPQKPDDGGPRKMPTVEERVERMKKDLGITDEQAAKIKPIIEDFRKEMDKVREEANGDRGAMREKVRPLMDSMNAKIDEVLTPEQKAKFDEMRKRFRGGPQGGGGGNSDSGKSDSKDGDKKE